MSQGNISIGHLGCKSLASSEVIMREIVNIRQLARFLGEITEDIAYRYNVEPEVVCAIVDDYGREMGKQLRKLIVISEN